MQCNIDAKGKAMRLLLGGAMVLLAAGASVLILLDVLGPAWWWGAAGLAAFGGFGVFEGWAGWCAVRAMGFKTRL
jgi:hypothetical protein